MARTLSDAAASVATIVMSEPMPVRIPEPMAMAVSVPFVPAVVAAAVDPGETASEVEPVSSAGDVEPEFSGGWSEETAEAEFLAEARDRGEGPKTKIAVPEATEERETKPLPTIEELVERIPAGVRDTLEDLFRAKFVNVQRVPKRALKSAK